MQREISDFPADESYAIFAADSPVEATMKKSRALPLLLLSGACVAQSGDATEIERALRGAEAQSPRVCIGVQQLGRTHVDPQTRSILFEGRDGFVYVNRIREGCPALRRGMTLVTNTPSGSLCEGDSVGLIDVDGSSRISCQLGPFTPYRPGTGPLATGR
jgi:hypothetical protein